MIRSGFIILLLAPVLMGCGAETGSGDPSEWPGRKPIYVAVFVAPGGSTDLSNRAMAAAMERELGATFSVLNMPGAQGGVAAAYVTNAERDGHTWFGISEGVLGMPVLGAHETTSADWRYFLIAGTPGVLSVPEGSPYQSVEDLIADVRARPGEVKIASSAPGTAWHVQFLALSEAGDLDFRWVSYPGSHPSQVAALSGEIDVVLTGLGEQAEFLRAGRLRPLAVTQTDPYMLEDVGSIPPITEVVPELEAYLPLQQMVGFALPADTPQPILDQIEAAFGRAMQSKEVQDFAASSYSTLLGFSGEEAQTLVEDEERTFTWLLYESGLAQNSPETFGIARPDVNP